MKALFVGRFQPFHNGHLRVLKTVYKDFDEIIIGIGSSQYSNTLENPFTAEERKEMIEKTLDREGIKNYKIYFIPDIHNYPKWVSHVESIVPKFDVVISNNLLTSKLFSEKGYIVRNTPLFEREKYSGKEIRRRMLEGREWKNLVPKQVVDIIEKIKGVERIKNLKK
ncbi:MAG: nicotinamide-nucleotide adenylyltransferase [Thermoplasmata archaeon]|nr:MAG: nicotinamide-nucleotide adenylyltransferase [Thermoplasmata archaeon]RLF61870.1 MAG: nicotinamide-nucleotide adenylyltransferase [Thermoplasmata archaeon]